MAMFGWGRKNDGFEWHKHVRTTIKLRREDRRARMSDARDVAADGLKYAGRASVSASNSGVVALWNGLISAIQWIIRLTFAGRDAMARTMERAIAPASRSVLGKLDPWLKRLGKSPLMLIMAAVGVVAFHAAFARSRGAGLRSEVVLTAAIGTLALLVGVLPLLTGHVRWSSLRSSGGGIALPRPLRGKQGLSVGLAVVALVAVGGGYLAWRKTPVSLPSFASFNPFAAKPIEGRASVLSSDLIRIASTTIRLSGVEAPDANQKCMGANKKTWACGEQARSAVDRLVKGKTLRCDLSGSDDAGRPLGTCMSGTQNIAEELVREGAVFASGGLFSPLSGIEAEARAKKVGLWKGDAERPTEYRAKVWDAAVKGAPDGCPIKGQVSGDSKTYVLPWQSDYSSVKLRLAKGERWFCSESEAQAAGWKVANR